MPEVRLIDANAMIQNHCGACANKEFCAEESCPYYEIRRRIEAAPTIEAEPVRHGEWRECWHTDTVCASICTNCGKAATQARHIVGQEMMTNVRYPLCPNCGADMREGGADNG